MKGNQKEHAYSYTALFLGKISSNLLDTQFCNEHLINIQVENLIDSKQELTFENPNLCISIFGNIPAKILQHFVYSRF